MTLRRSLIAIAAVLIAGPCWGWNDTGHMLMARLTFAALSADQRAVMARTLAGHPRFREDFQRLQPRSVADADVLVWQFAQAATWPDVARHFGHERAEQRERLVSAYHHGPWHYVNLVLRVDARGAYLTEAGPPERPAVGSLADAQDIVAALDAIAARWGGMRAAERGVALCWLLHLMGDLHQPLHTTKLVAPGRLEGGDRGGNEIRVRSRTVRARNLHALWDGALGDSRDWAWLGDELDELPLAVSTAASIDFLDWAEQGRALAREEVYTSGLRRRVAAQSAATRSAEFSPDAAYLEAMRERARSQIALAAQRTVVVLGALTGQ